MIICRHIILFLRPQIFNPNVKEKNVLLGPMNYYIQTIIIIIIITMQ